MAIARMHSVGLGDRLVHVDYANHFVYPGHDGEASKQTMLAHMKVRFDGGVARFGKLDPKTVFNSQTDLESATANFVSQALRSTANDQLWFICAGPMTTAHPEVTFHLIKNQNIAGGERGLCSALEHWEWQKNSANADLRWRYSLGPYQLIAG